MLKKKTVLLFILPLLLFFISLFIGRYPISPMTAIQVIASKIFPIEPHWPAAVENIIFRIRLPRTLLAVFVGAALSVSGASFQGMFRNPLVSPDILGVSAAAGFGAALAILVSGNSVIIQLYAFVSGIIGVVLTYLLSRIYKTTPVVILVLSGVVVGAFFSALISGIKYIADPYEKLPAITFWLMGSLASASIGDLLTSIPMIAIGITGLLIVRWRINILAMGDEEARSLGIRTETLKLFIIICCTLITASAVCVSGMVGWVGLIIPHVGRMLVGPDHKQLLPASIALGASFLLIIDTLSRSLISAEIPLGILTAMIGAPFFAYLIKRTKGGWK